MQVIIRYTASPGWYCAECDGTQFYCQAPNNDHAVGKIVRSKWMDEVFAKHGRVRIVCQF